MNRRERVGGCLLWAVLGPLLFAAGLYWSWCWGWWGRESRLLQYLLQCQCPRASAEARYPDTVDVLVSACEDPYYNGAAVSPSGRYSFFRIRRPTAQRYLYDRNQDSYVRVSDPPLGGGGFSRMR